MRSRIGFFFSEAIRSLSTNIATSVAATVAMIVALVVFGMFFFFLLVVNNFASDVEEDAARVKVFLEDTASEDEVNAIRVSLEENSSVSSIEYLNKDDALDRAREMFKDNPEVLEELPVNPFPASLEAEVSETTEVASVSATIGDMPGVLEVNDGGEKAEKVISFARWIQWTAFALAGVLLFASTILVSNTIRLSIFARRREIEVMKLVGASNSFVRVPFMMEGFLVGFFGAIGAVVFLSGIAWGVQRLITSSLGLGSLPADVMGIVALAVLGVGLVLGTLGSGMTIRKFLRV